MEPETKTIAVIGALAVDRIMFVPRLPKAGGSIIATHAEKALGGKSANTALSTYRSCHNKASLPKGDSAFRVKMIGSAGNDHYGEALTQKLLENGIDVSDVKGVPRLPSAGTALHISSRLWVPPEQGEWSLLFIFRRLRRLIHLISDTFTGAYAADYIRQISSPSVEWDIESAAVHANKAAAISIGSTGAQGHIPWADELDQFDTTAEMTFDLLRQTHLVYSEL